MKKKVSKTIQKYQLIEKNDKIVVGVSGGPDSMCLLNILKELAIEVVVAHINHGIRKEALEDENYVKQYCEKNGIEFYAKSIDVQKLAHTKKIGIEEAGRVARYEFFEEVRQKTKATKIAVAHNKNDKIETILLHVLRGSGIEGLKGIEPKRGNIIRPLLECERIEIETYCEENKLNPRIDKTNFENDYQRNKIRNVVIPYIQKEFNPNFITTLERLSHIAEEESNYIEEKTQQIYQQIVEEEAVPKQIILDLKAFNLQETVIKARLIRYTIKRLLGNITRIEKVHIKDIIKLCGNQIGNKFLTPNKEIKILVKNHKIYFIKQ